MTLNQLIDDVLLEARNNQITESEKLSRHQIQLWIISYRAFLIKQDLDRKRDINPDYVQTIKMHISKRTYEGHDVYVSDDELPALIDSNFQTGVISVKDLYGNILQLGSETKMKLQKYRKYTSNDYIVYQKHNRLFLQDQNNLLEWIQVDVIAEDPTELIMCYDPYEDRFPVPAAMWATIKQLIFDREFNIMISAPSDITNNSQDDTLNNGATRQPVQQQQQV